MIKRRLDFNNKTSIPQPVRVALGLEPGDSIRYEIEGDRVFLTQVDGARDQQDSFRCFNEWSTKADQQAYSTL